MTPNTNTKFVAPLAIRVKVDAVAWALEYSMDPTDTGEIEQDVQSYIATQLQECSAVRAGLIEVTVS